MSAHIASSNEASDQSVQFFVDELARFHLYQESLKSPSTLVTTIAESSNPNTCLVSSSSSEWVIDPRATDHMTGNSSLFSTFQSQPSPSIVTLADGSQSCVLGSGTILINRMPSFVLNWATPFQIPFPHKSLFLIEPRVFGCTCFVWDVRPHVFKLDPKSLKCIFFGYSRVQKGYRCYCPSLRRYLVSIDVTFIENTPFSPNPIHTS